MMVGITERKTALCAARAINTEGCRSFYYSSRMEYRGADVSGAEMRGSPLPGKPA